LGNVEKGMIIAFFVIYGVISTVTVLMKSFLDRY